MAYTMLSETKMTWARTKDDLADTFRKWGVEQYDVQCLAWGQRSQRRELPREERRVVVRFVHPDNREIVLVMEDWTRPIDNFRQLYKAIESMRDIYNRGVENTIRAAYMQLAAPTVQRDPYEVLGIRSDTDIEVAEAAYKALAKKHHPDTGGSVELMRELNEAIERIRQDKAA